MVGEEIQAGGRRAISDNFTIVRLLLALAVVFSHSYALVGQPEPLVFGRTVGNFAVHCFFVISGYLVSGSWARSPGLKFVGRRVARLTPALALAYLFSLLAAKLFDNYAGQQFPGVINGSLWTISWEILLYIGVTMFGTLWLLSPATLGSLYATGLLLVIVALEPHSSGVVVAPLVLLFLCGAFLRLEKRIDIRKIGPVALLVLALLFAPGISHRVLGFMQYWSLIFAWDVTVFDVRYYIYLVALPIGLIFLCAFAPISIKVRVDLSYAVFVFAWPVQQICVHYMLAWALPLQPMLLFLASASLSMMIAVPVWLYVEKPINRWRPIGMGQARQDKPEGQNSLAERADRTARPAGVGL